MPRDSKSPAKARNGGAPRVAVVYGSEGGTCEMIAKSYAKTFAPACESIETLTGLTLANRMPDLKKVAASFDVLVICTSSYGSGDPPANFEKFLDQLRRAVADEKRRSLGSGARCWARATRVHGHVPEQPAADGQVHGRCGSRRFVARQDRRERRRGRGGLAQPVPRRRRRPAQGLPAPTAAAIAWASRARRTASRSTRSRTRASRTTP